MASDTLTKEVVLEALKTVYDPEIPVNIVDLGLVYEVEVKDGGGIYVQMTLTFPGCGMGPFIAQQAARGVGETGMAQDCRLPQQAFEGRCRFRLTLGR